VAGSRTFPQATAAALIALLVAACPCGAGAQGTAGGSATGLAAERSVRVSAGAVAGIDALAMRHRAVGIPQPQRGVVGAVEGWLGTGALRLYVGYAEGQLTGPGPSRALAEGHASIAARLHRGVELRLGPRAIVVSTGGSVDRWSAWQGAVRIESPLAVPGLRVIAEAWGGSGTSAGSSPGLPDGRSASTGGSAGLAWRALHLEYLIESTRAGDRDALVVERLRLRAHFGARGPAVAEPRNSARARRAP
jgi:hypothetical protein